MMTGASARAALNAICDTFLLLGSAAGFDALRAQQPGWTDAPATTIEVPYAHARADAPKLKFTFAQAGSPAN